VPSISEIGLKVLSSGIIFLQPHACYRDQYHLDIGAHEGGDKSVRTVPAGFFEISLFYPNKFFFALFLSRTIDLVATAP